MGMCVCRGNYVPYNTDRKELRKIEGHGEVYLRESLRERYREGEKRKSRATKAEN